MKIDRRDVLKVAGASGLGALTAKAGAHFENIFPPHLQEFGPLTSCDANAIVKLDGNLNETSTPGGAGQIGVSADGSVVCCLGIDGKFYHLVNGAWQQMASGSGRCISVGKDGTVWALGSNQDAGGFGVWKWNGTNWTSVPGYLMALQVGSANGVVGINSYGGAYAWNGSGWTNLGRPASGDIFVSVCVSYDSTPTFFAQTQDSWVYKRTLSGPWTSICYFQYPAMLAAVSATQCYALTETEVYTYNSSQNTFDYLSTQPPYAPIQISACSDGTLWVTDGGSHTQKYNGTSWSSTTAGGLAFVMGGSSNIAYGLNYSQICIPAAGTNNPIPMLQWLTQSMIYTQTGLNAGAMTNIMNAPGSFMSNHASDLAAIASSGGATLPPFSHFQSITSDLSSMWGTIDVCGVSSLVAYLFFKPGDNSLPSLQNLFLNNIPPATSVVQLLNATSINVYTDMLSTMYGIGAPTGGLQNGNGWLDYVTIPSFGTSTVAAGIDGFTLQTILDDLASFSSYLNGLTSYSQVDCGKLKTQINHWAVAASIFVGIGVFCLLFGLVWPPMIGVSYFYAAGAIICGAWTLHLLAVYKKNCGQVNWSNWGNL